MPPGTLQSLRILFRNVGFWRTLWLGWRIAKRERKGEPFAALPPPDSEEERLSRAQIAPGILLYQELLQFLPAQRAYDIAEETIVSGAIAFLKQTIGPLRSQDIAPLSPAQREAFDKERGKRFFNATMRWDTIEPEKVVFTITACRFPRLCREAGSPELAPAFCKGDATFFGSVEPNVQLQRPHTIAKGAPSCLFVLEWVGESLQTPPSPSTSTSSKSDQDDATSA